MGIREDGVLGLADDSASFLSPRLFGRLSLPYLQAYCAAFPGCSGRGLHICGNSTHFLGQLAALRLSSFDMGEMVNLRRARAMLPETYLWHIADFRLIRDGGPREIEAYVERQLALGTPEGRFGIHMEGWRGVPLWKARLVKDAVERYNVG
jgi:uroporphyrinogen-III decarboxylase